MMRFSRTLSHQQIGHALSEYGLIIGLVVIASIASLSFLGEQVSSQLGSTIGKRNLVTNQLPTSPFGRWTQAQLFHNATQQAVTLPNGSKINITIPNYNELTETAGPNGQVSAALASLNQFIADLKKAGVPQDVIQELVNLSETGHQIANQLERQDQFTSLNWKKLNPDGNTAENLNLSNDYKSGHYFPPASMMEQMQIVQNENGAYAVSHLPFRPTNITATLAELHPAERLFVQRMLVDQALEKRGLSALKPAIFQLSEQIRSANSQSNHLLNASVNGDSLKITDPVPAWMTARVSSNGICTPSGSTTCQHP
jgi:Flp pilus assembly pilin Flp